MPGNLTSFGICETRGLLGRSGVISKASSLAQKDAAAYRALLASNGKTLLEADYQKIVSFASQLYSAAGKRVDFLMLRNTQNMGTGAVAYTFHGTSCTLVNGPTWGADGVAATASGKVATSWPVPNYPHFGLSVMNWTSSVGVLHFGAFGATGDRRLFMGGGNGLVLQGGNYGASQKVSYTHVADNTYATAWAIARDFGSAACSGGTTAGETVLINGTTTAGLTNDYVCGNDWNTFPASSVVINSGSSAAQKSAFLLWSAGSADKATVYAAYKSTIGSGLSLP